MHLRRDSLGPVRLAKTEHLRPQTVVFDVLLFDSRNL